jgi:cytochrome c oxidase cbb3-type subunit 2
MPSYAYLFWDRRGDDLVAYLESLRSSDSLEHILKEAAAWRPACAAAAQAGQLNGATLFREYCATCHDADGYVRIRWGSDFKDLPSNLVTAPLRDVSEQTNPADVHLRLAQIVKFGLPGTDMPGHEYLADAQIEAIARYVASLRRGQ